MAAAGRIHKPQAGHRARPGMDAAPGA
jgi:hypothetical protein